MVFSKSRGLINDSISDMLTRIRNATLTQKSNVNIPFTKLNLELAKILEKEGFIQSFHLGSRFELQTNDTGLELNSGSIHGLGGPKLGPLPGAGAPGFEKQSFPGGKNIPPYPQQDFNLTGGAPAPILIKRGAGGPPDDIVIRLKYNSKKLYKGKIKESCITNLRRISKPGLRIYVNSREIPRILNGTGIAIISTPSGIMTDREARARKLGGELLCSVW